MERLLFSGEKMVLIAAEGINQEIKSKEAL